MRDWILRKLNGVDRELFNKLLLIHRQYAADVERMVKHYHLQASWQEAKLHRKRMN